MGMNWRRPQLNAGSSNDPRGIIGTSDNVGGYAFAGWLMGYVSSTQTAEGLAYNEGRQNRWSAYFLDDWKATRKLTVNYGLRWDFFQAPYDNYGAWRNLRFDVLSTGADGKQYPTFTPAPYTKGVRIVEKDNRYFMPRVGIAYRPTDKWVMRARRRLVRRWPADGEFQHHRPHSSKRRQLRFHADHRHRPVPSLTPTPGQNYNIQTRKIRAGTDVLSLDNMFPTDKPAGSRVNLIVDAAQQQVRQHVAVELRYPAGVAIQHVPDGRLRRKRVQASGYHRTWFQQCASLDKHRRQQPASLPVLCQPGGGQHGAAAGHHFGTWIATRTATTTHCRSLLEKRYTNGLTFGMNYSYSKALGDNGGIDRNSGASVQQNVRNRRADYGRVNFDVTIPRRSTSCTICRSCNGSKVWLAPFSAAGRPTASSAEDRGALHPQRRQRPEHGQHRPAGPPDRWAPGQSDTRAVVRSQAFQRVTCNNPARPDLCHFGKCRGIIS